MARENGSVPDAPERKRDVPPEMRENASVDAEDALGDRLADVFSDVEKAGPQRPTLDELDAAANGEMPVPDEMKKEASTIDSAIGALKSRMKGMLESVEGALKGRRSFDYEYRDADGNLLCRAKAELGTSKKRVPLDTADGREGRARILHSLVLEGEKDGRPVSVDVLRLANKYGDPVLVGTERLENSAYDHNERNVIVSSIETPLDLATLLHELGHADQSRERRFAAGVIELRQPEASQPNAADIPADEIEEIMKKVADAIPEAVQFIDQDALAKIKALEAEMKGLSDGPENVKQRDALYARKKTLIEETLRLEDLALLPKRMLERDATRRAFLWLRELRKKGIDLLGQLPSPQKAPAGRKTESQGCEQAVVSGLPEAEAQADASAETTVREELDRSLRTYKAERTRFKKPGGIGPGLRPSAGSRRKAK